MPCFSPDFSAKLTKYGSGHLFAPASLCYILESSFCYNVATSLSLSALAGNLGHSTWFISCSPRAPSVVARKQEPQDCPETENHQLEINLDPRIKEEEDAKNGNHTLHHLS